MRIGIDMTYEEREIKLYVRDLEALASRVEICGADLVRERVFERNVRLDTADHRLQNEGRLLRLRKDDRAAVTYKADAHMEGGIVSRTEIELNVDNFEVAQKLFEALGYRKTVVYEKYRRVYKLGDVLVMLDELPFGDFVEIEAPNNILIDGMAQMLGLNVEYGIRTNYLGLFEMLKLKQTLKFKDLTFENFQHLEITQDDLGVEPADA
jgi:adenylate cyclase class 2